MDRIDFEHLKKYKNKYPEFNKRGVMIDIGSRNMNGSVAWFVKPPVKYIGVDIRNLREDLIESYVNIYPELKESGLEKYFSLPDPYVTWCGLFHEYHGMPDNSIDLVISFNMFEHDEFWNLTVKRAVELLKPGGRFIFQVMTGGPEHGEDYMERKYNRVDKNKFINYLKSFGVNIEEIEDIDRNGELSRFYIIGIK